jgi:hypothetical protein
MALTPKFQLHGLQKLLATPPVSENEPGGSVKSVPLGDLVAAEVAAIKECLLEKALTIDGEDTIRRFVHIHQYSLICIMDQVAEHPAQHAAFPCYGQLHELLSFIRQHFSDYFNYQATAPLMDATALLAEVNVCLPRLTRILENASPEPFILDTVLYPLRTLMAPNAMRPTFNRIRHIKHILRHLEMVSQRGYRGQNLDHQLFESLLYLNYNSRQTFVRVTEYFRALVPELLDRDEQILFLSEYLKQVNQATVKPGTAYHCTMPTLQSQLANYLREEITYLKGPGQLQQWVEEEPGSSLPFKLKFDLSVSQLACLLRLLTDARVIECENTSALIRFVAFNCETKHAGRISPKSLRIKYYDIEPGTNKAVYQKLTTLVKSIDATLSP